MKRYNSLFEALFNFYLQQSGDDSADSDDILELKEEEKDSSRLPRGGNKQLTMKYDMKSLSKLTEIDNELRKCLAEIYHQDPDEDFPIEIDLIEVISKPQQSRRKFMVRHNVL